MNIDTLRKALAEFVGTFTLLFAVVASIVTADQVAGVFGIAIAQGIAIAMMVSAVGHISGAHFNPAITFGALLTRRIGILLAGVYVVVQLAGAVAAVLVVEQLYPDGIDFSTTVPTLQSVDPWQGLLLEALATFFLVWVVFATAIDPRGSFTVIAGIGIGAAITFGVLLLGPITGGVMNPARAFGTELVEWKWTNAWLYYIGPLVGGGLAALIYDGVYLAGREGEPEGPGLPAPEEGPIDVI
jgi:MIP family channel proteins